MLKISAGSSDLGALRTPALAILLEQGANAPNLGTLDSGLAASVRRVLDSRDFRSGRDETLQLLGVERSVERLLLVGMGKVTDRGSALKRAAAIAARKATQLGFGRLAIYAGNVNSADAEVIALGAIAGAWELKEYQSPPPDDERRAPLIEATILADDGLNIATLRLTRKERGGDAFMVIELDEAPDEKARDDIRSLPWVRWAYRLDKVSG
jgi:leucyl aminopeptidase